MVMMRIYAKTLTGKTCSLANVDGNLTTVYELKERLSDGIEMPAELQRIIYGGQELHDDNASLSEYKIPSESILHVAFRARSMISTFTSRTCSTNRILARDTNDDDDSDDGGLEDDDNKLIQYLMGHTRRAPLKCLAKKAKEEYADDLATFSYQACSILSESQRSRLVSFLNFMWIHNRMSKGDDRRVDMRLVVPDQQFLDLLGPLEDEHDFDTRAAKRTLQGLHQAFANVPTASPSSKPKIVLRQTRGPTNACINFHCDGPYASSTTQIALNDPTDYKGGCLIYYVNGQVYRLEERPAGSMVQHPPQVLHGVTCLESGTRSSLFVVDQQNGHGEEGVIVVAANHVRSFMESLDEKNDNKSAAAQL